MLSVPYSWMRWTKFSRSPVRSEAIAITVDTPITIPRTVSALLNLCALILSRAMDTISECVTVPISMLVLCERDDRVEARRAKSGIDTRDHADASGNHEGQDDVRESYRHWNRCHNCNDPGDTGRQHQADHAPNRRKQHRLDKELQHD